MKLSDNQLKIMASGGHLLVTGGPGSGKTTVSILKAANIAECDLRPGQKVLFLSFARATVSRVVEAIEYEQKIPIEQKKRIDVDTYHSFFWRLLKTHGYLVGLPRILSILTPPDEAIILSNIRNSYSAESKLDGTQKAEKHAAENAERIRLAVNNGCICFDLFAQYAGDILHGSERIRKLIATMYPVIILDEFQDTNEGQWRVVQALGDNSTLLALADPEQRIYDWIGANPERLNHFRGAFAPIEVDLSSENHRSAGTDIVAFGNDILKGRFGKEKYIGVHIEGYPPNANQAFSALVVTTLKARKRLIESGQENWSLAVLVPTKKMTRNVSACFMSPPARMPKIHHAATIEMEAAILGAEIIALLMEPDKDGHQFIKLLTMLQNYFLGKGGDNPTKKDIGEASRIQKAHDDWRTRQEGGKAINKKSIMAAIIAVYNAARVAVLTGNPEKDWLQVRRILEAGPCPRLQKIAEEARNIRILERGEQLRRELSQDWIDNGAYANALKITQQAFVREHFATNAKPECGVVVMNMHKAKGKQFDEVIIFEGWPIHRRGQPPFNADRIVRYNSRSHDTDQARQNLRVSVTRGKMHTTILTPNNDPCVLLIEND